MPGIDDMLINADQHGLVRGVCVPTPGSHVRANQHQGLCSKASQLRFANRENRVFLTAQNPAKPLNVPAHF